MVVLGEGSIIAPPPASLAAEGDRGQETLDGHVAIVTRSRPHGAALHWLLARGGLTPGGETCPGLAAVPWCGVGGGCCGYASYFGHANLFHVNIVRTELHHSLN